MESNMQASPTGGRRAYKWLALLVVILLLFCTWLFFRQQSLRHDLSQVGKGTLRLEGTALLLEGKDGSRVDLFPIIKEQFDIFAKDLTKVTNVYNTYPVTENTVVEQTGGGSGGTSTPQTLSISGSVLSISGGNSVNLPSGSSGDPEVGNEILDVAAGGGLLRVGAGTTVDPYKISIQDCANNEILKSDGTNWNCATESGGSPYTAGSGLQLVGNQFSVNSPTCAGTTKLQWNGAAFVCATDQDTTYSAGTGLSLVGTTFNNTGVLSVAGSGAVTSTGGQNPTVAFANGSLNGQFWQWNGAAWVLATLPVDGDSVIGNEITNVTGGNVGLVRSGSGTSVDPYTIAANVGNGMQLVGNAITVNSPTCAGTTKLQWNGTAFICATDQDTTYSAGTGLSLVGTTFNNTGVLSVAGSGAITSTGGQNPTVAFADGTINGQFWQWDGDSWELATIPASGDPVVGNEITNITGANAGLVRSGSGTSIDPYTIAANVGNGIQLVSNAITINSPTCAGTTKLQWTGTAFLCATDQDTTYSAGTGLNLVGTTFSNAGVITVSGSGAITSTGGQNPTIAFANGSSNGQVWQWNGSAWVLATVAPTTCAVGGTYACDGGNTLASSLDIGTNDNNALNLRINNATAATLATTGSLSLVNGALTLGGTNTVGFTTPQAITIQTKINIPVYDPGSFGQVVAMGVGSAAQSTARVLSLFDNRSGSHQPTLAVFAPNENNMVGFSYEGDNSIARIKNTSGAVAIRNNTTDNVYFAANGDVGIGLGTNAPNGRLQVGAASGIIFNVTDTTATAASVFTVQDEGLAVFQNKTDMTSAFRVVSVDGTVVFSINTTNKSVNIGEGNVNVGSNPSLLVLDHSSASSDPTGINGAMYYNQAFNSLRCYENGTWKSCIAPVDADITMNATNGTTWTAMPAALTELFGTTTQRTSLDTTGGAVQARIMANISVAGAAGSQLRAQYSVNDGGSWQYLDGVSGPNITIDSTGLKVSSWVNLESGAKVNENTWFRVVGITGDGAVNPVIGNVKIQLR